MRNGLENYNITYCFKVALVIATFALAEFVQAAANVQYAGFSYLTEFSQIEKRFPYVSHILRESDDGAGSLLDKRLRDLVANVEAKHIHLKVSSLGKLGQGSSTVVTLALTRELVATEKIGNLDKLLVEISALVIYFDYETMSIIGSTPISIQYIDASETGYTEEQKLSVVRSLLMGEMKVDLVDEFAIYLTSATVESKYGNTIKVAEVLLSEEALEIIPEYIGNSESAKTYLAQSFSEYLSANQDILLLPYTKGHAIGNKMAAAFSDGAVFNLTIPEADFEIHLSLKGFKKILFSENNVGQSWVYGAFTQVTVVEPLSGKVYSEFPFKNGATKLIPQSQQSWQDWPAYQEALLSGYDQLTSSLDSPSNEWVKSHTGDAKNKKQLAGFKEVVYKCK